MEKKRIIIIGGGPGGYVAAIRAAQLGARVTLIEKEYIGGTCLNVGCIPTKFLLHSAEMFRNIREHGAEMGIEAAGLAVNFAKVMASKETVSQQLKMGVTGLLKANQITIVMGRARFIDKNSPRKILVAKKDGLTETMTADAIIIAAGSVNAVPPISGIEENPACVDSTGALSLAEIPKRLVVIGCGVIGLELAAAYMAFGAKVVVLEMMEAILPAFDQDIVAAGLRHLAGAGVEFHFGCQVQKVAAIRTGAKVFCKDKKDIERTFESDKVLIAAGRRANTEQLALDVGGIRHERGYILVNNYMETNVPGIYAIGDCVLGNAGLAHTAAAMGEAAAENICGIRSEYNPATSPSCLYIEPEAASVGLTEKQAQEGGISYLTGTFPLAANGKALILNGGDGLVKIIAEEKSKRILGVHIIGPRATDLIGEGALAIKMQATVNDVIATIHSHPTVSEAVREAALNVENRSIHILNRR